LLPNFSCPKCIIWKKWGCICSHRLCRICFETQPNEDAMSVRNITLCPCTWEFQKLPKLGRRTLRTTKFKFNYYHKRSYYISLTVITILKCFLEENYSQLRMSQWQSPETQIRSRVWNSSQYILNCLNELMNEYLTRICITVSMLIFIIFLTYFNFWRVHWI
jgi:hypothetical protein